MISPATPLVLGANPIRRFYRGGPRIASFRRVDGWDARAPEDWVGSCTCVFGEDDLGRARLPDGRMVRDAIVSDPIPWLGEAHVRSFGAEPGLLVKLLDAGERLPVHWHPDRAFARRHLGLRFGKTEAWVIVDADEDAVVHLGFARDVERAEAERWLREQDVDAMLGAMHRRHVAPGETVLVPAGTPHAIGAGILLVELQEPTDLSILLEWRGFDVDGERDGHLGVGFEVALSSLRRTAVADEELEGWTSSRGSALFPADADPYFRAERLEGDARLDPGFAIVVVVDGEGSVRSPAGDVGIRRGMTLLLPFAAGPVTCEGDADVIVCRPAERAPA